MSCLAGAKDTPTANLCSGAWQEYAERRALRAELKALQKEERHRQQRAIDEVLQGELAENSLDIQLLQMHLQHSSLAEEAAGALSGPGFSPSWAFGIARLCGGVCCCRLACMKSMVTIRRLRTLSGTPIMP